MVDVGNDLLSSDQDIMLLIAKEELHDVFFDHRTHRHPATIGIIDLAICVPAVKVEMMFLDGIDRGTRVYIHGQLDVAKSFA